jgi:hypothetical protein
MRDGSQRSSLNSFQKASKNRLRYNRGRTSVKHSSFVRFQVPRRGFRLVLFTRVQRFDFEIVVSPS